MNDGLGKEERIEGSRESDGFSLARPETNRLASMEWLCISRILWVGNLSSRCRCS